MQKAEDIVKENNYENIAVISGIGVRGYYRKLGYRLKNTYMVK
jgi:elongator complex protein 3